MDVGLSLHRAGEGPQRGRNLGTRLLGQLFSVTTLVFRFLLPIFFSLSETHICLSVFADKAGVGTLRGRLALGRGELVFTPGAASGQGGALWELASFPADCLSTRTEPAHPHCSLPPLRLVSPCPAFTCPTIMGLYLSLSLQDWTHPAANYPPIVTLPLFLACGFLLLFLLMKKL